MLSGTKPELLLTRTTVVSLALHALIGKLLETGVLEMADIVEMRSVGLQLVTDMRDSDEPATQIAAAELEHEVLGWWAALNAPPVKQNDA